MMVRAAMAEDIPELADILNGIIRAGGTTAMETPLSPAEFGRHFLHGPHVICCHVAVDCATRQPAGFQVLERSADPSAERVDIATFARPERKIPGVGTALFAATRERAKALGVVTIIAQIRADNRSGLAYYEKMGFRAFMTLPGVPLRDGTPVDRVLKRYDVAVTS